MAVMGRPKKADGPKKFVHAAFEQDELKQLKKLCKERGETMSAVVRHFTLLGLRKAGARHAT